MKLTACKSDEAVSSSVFLRPIEDVGKGVSGNSVVSFALVLVAICRQE